jgi:hypothetical protein
MGYPAGAKLPPNGSPFSFHLKDLSAVYAHLLEFHSDDKIERGKPPAADPSQSQRNTMKDGDIFRIELKHGGWEVIRDHSGGGISGQMQKGHHSIAAALDSIKLLSDVA